MSICLKLKRSKSQTLVGSLQGWNDNWSGGRGGGRGGGGGGTVSTLVTCQL